ncbi:MAG: DNA polymerase III subunit beta [Deltaproteobacteria bacterium]|nr:DNA polymerase III subunit beta [Deltaproteobacteria bacterium]
MELNIRVPELTRALHRVQGIVEKKTTKPVLASVLIRTRGQDRIAVSATDLEIALTGDYEAEVVKEGSITIGAKALYDIVRSLPEEHASLKRTANNWVEIVCGKVKYRLVANSDEEFPKLPAFSDAAFFSVDAAVVRGMIDKTLYAVSTDETRYNLTGVYCEALAREAGLRMVATDGHRLSVVERTTPQAPIIKDGVIIPRKGLIELRKILDDAGEDGRLAFVDNSAVFESSGLTLTMRLVDGRFPDYQQVIPTAFSRQIRLSRATLTQALKRTSLLAPDKGQGVRFDLTENTLSLTTNNPDLGEAREDIDVAYEGEPLRIGFNVRYVMDALSVITEENAVIELTDELSPGVFYGAGAEGYRAVVMPMRI